MCVPQNLRPVGVAGQYGLAVKIHGFYPGALGLTPGVGMRLLVACRTELGDFRSRSRGVKGEFFLLLLFIFILFIYFLDSGGGGGGGGPLGSC